MDTMEPMEIVGLPAIATLGRHTAAKATKGTPLSRGCQHHRTGIEVSAMVIIWSDTLAPFESRRLRLFPPPGMQSQPPKGGPRS